MYPSAIDAVCKPECFMHVLSACMLSFKPRDSQGNTVQLIPRQSFSIQTASGEIQACDILCTRQMPSIN